LHLEKEKINRFFLGGFSRLQLLHNDSSPMHFYGFLLVGYIVRGRKNKLCVCVCFRQMSSQYV
jgi:hypothetical protein